VKTDDLISFLSTGVEPVSRRPARLRFAVALAAGTLSSIALTAALLRVNVSLPIEAVRPEFWVRAAYCAALGAIALALVLRLARPARSLGCLPAALAGVVVGMWLLALAVLMRAAPGDRVPLLLGHTAAVCPFLIAVLALPSFIALSWAVRGLAPTRLRRAGAACGFTAGAIGALGYTLHCPELAPPFIGVWYLLGMVISAGVGALLGPRVLRW
jgi:hypothetical protein